MAPPIGKIPRGNIKPRAPIPGTATAAPLVNEGYVSVSATGVRAVYAWGVTGLSGPEDLRLAYAIQVIGIPRYGDWHPVLNVPVSDVRAEPVKDSPSQAKVIVEYGLHVEPGGWFNNEPSEITPAQFEVVSTVQSTTTNMHMAGNKMGQQIIVSHWEEDEEAQQSIERKQGGEVAYEQPMHMVIARRRENTSPGIPVPGARKQSVWYVGHTNDGSYFGDPAGMWLCTKMDGYSDDNGLTWNVTYEFQRRAPNWNATAWYRDPATGQPVDLPDDTAPANATEVETVVLYPQRNFKELRLFA